MTQGARLALSKGFFDAFAVLPRAQRHKVGNLVKRFGADSTSSGLNLEPVRASDGMCSLRIDKSYRAIVLKPRHGKVYLLLWADKHDEAYAWARRHQCCINSETGALQVYEPEKPARPPGRESPGPVPAREQPRAFAQLRDRQLRRLGVPDAMLAEVRGMDGEDALERARKRLPEEAYEALFLYLAGDSYEELIRDRETPARKVDPSDVAKALEHSETQGSFVFVENERELQKMLNAPLEKWRVFLHPRQRRLVERHWNGPVRVLGGAGTGKTAAAMHRARWLASKLSGRDRILFVTYTRNLAADIEHSLRSICSPEEMGRIDVVNLDLWVRTFLRRRGHDFPIVYNRTRAPWNAVWRRALSHRDPSLRYSDAFYEDELDHVVLAQGISTEERYLDFDRQGRGTQLHPNRRPAVWRVFENYRAGLEEQGARELDDAYGYATKLLEADRGEPAYAAAVVDEAQDMGPQAYRLLRALVPEGPDDLFIVGDGHQRIFGRSRVVLSHCGIRVVGRSRKLRRCYRTTAEIIGWAAPVLDGRYIDNLNGGRDDNRGLTSLTRGPQPQVHVLRSQEQQVDFIARWLQDLATRGESLSSTCIVARTQRERDAMDYGLRKRGLSTFILDRIRPGPAAANDVRLATMHRVKGLEFDHVIMASVNRGLLPLPYAIDGCADDIARERAETEERSLVYVAATRARRELVVLAYGAGSGMVQWDGGAWGQPGAAST